MTMKFDTKPYKEGDKLNMTYCQSMPVAADLGIGVVAVYCNNDAGDTARIAMSTDQARTLYEQLAKIFKDK